MGSGVTVLPGLSYVRPAYAGLEIQPPTVGEDRNLIRLPVPLATIAVLEHSDFGMAPLGHHIRSPIREVHQWRARVRCATRHMGSILDRSAQRYHLRSNVRAVDRLGVSSAAPQTPLPGQCLGRFQCACRHSGEVPRPGGRGGVQVPESRVVEEETCPPAGAAVDGGGELFREQGANEALDLVNGLGSTGLDDALADPVVMGGDDDGGGVIGAAVVCQRRLYEDPVGRVQGHVAPQECGGVGDRFVGSTSA